MTNIVVCFYKPADAELIKNIICRAGFRVAYSCSSGAKALEMCGKLGSGVIVSGYRLLDMICLDLYDAKPDHFKMVTVSKEKNWELSIPPKDMLTVDMPVNVNLLIDMIEEAERSIKKEQAQKKLLSGQNRTEEEKLIIEKAKQECINKAGMTEPEAHRHIQKVAMDKGISAVEAAKQVLKDSFICS